MSMTLEEAINWLETYLADYYDAMDIPDDLPCEVAQIALSALCPVSLEQVEKMGKGEWEDMREAYNDVPKRRCSRCKRVFIGLDKPFCEACGAPMTDEAVEMGMERFGGATR